jgi:hypothetical protein
MHGGPRLEAGPPPEWKGALTMPRTRPPVDLGRLLLAAVALIGVLLLLPAATTALA